MIFGADQTRQVIEDLYGVSYPKSSVIYNVIKLQSKKKPKNLLANFETRPTFCIYRQIAPQKRICRTNEYPQERLLDQNLLHSIAVIGGGNRNGKI